MTTRSKLWLATGIVLWSVAFGLSWMLQDAPTAGSIVGGILGGSAGLMIGRGLLFRRL